VEQKGTKECSAEAYAESPFTKTGIWCGLVIWKAVCRYMESGIRGYICGYVDRYVDLVRYVDTGPSVDLRQGVGWTEIRTTSWLGADRVETNGLAIQRKVPKGDANERQSMMTG
jgi:hypothetical protein